jgi:hypothetical protein
MCEPSGFDGGDVDRDRGIAGVGAVAVDQPERRAEAVGWLAGQRGGLDQLELQPTLKREPLPHRGEERLDGHAPYAIVC